MNANPKAGAGNAGIRISPVQPDFGAEISGVDLRHPLAPGTACFLGYDVKHEIVNEGPDELVMLWVISPPGLEDFFKTIGRPRAAGEAAPAPFERPADVVAIERRMGMNDTVRA